MDTAPLPPALADEVLTALGLQRRPPAPAYLNELLAAYTGRVPWESAFRIVRRAGTAATADCPRWPETFWREALTLGAGGTCFESNYAFYALLLALGYEGHLTINNMGEMQACHTAIVLHIEGRRWLADVGLPLFAALPIDPQAATETDSPFFRYTVRPDGPDRYQIERSPHPAPNCFTLIDRPIPDTPYRRATTADYGPGGLFLDRVIINKVVEGQLWRFNSGERPLHLAQFVGETRRDHPLGDDPATDLAAHFEMDRATIHEALALTEHNGG